MEKVSEESENQYEEIQESSEIDPRLLVSVKLESHDEAQPFAGHGQPGPSKIVDISHLCRACAKPYPVGSGTKLNPPPDDIAAHLEQLFGIQLREGDGLPTTLCDNCKSDVEHWVVVCRAVEEAQQFLKMNVVFPDPLLEHEQAMQEQSVEGDESGMDEGMDPHAAEMLTVECDTDMYEDMGGEQVFGIPDFGEFSQQYDMANKKKWSSERRRNFLLRAQGKEYQGFRKIGDKIVVVTRKARKVGPRCGFFCQRSNVRYCNEMSDAEREEVHRQFWNSTWAEKRVFVKNHVEEYETSRKSPSAVKHREKALRYYLDIAGQPRRVCQNFFMSTLDMKHSQIRHWLSSKVQHDVLHQRELKRRQRCEKIDSGQRVFQHAKDFVINIIDALPRRHPDSHPKSGFNSIRAVHRYCLHKAKEAEVHTLSWPVFFEIFHNKGLAASDLVPAEHDYKDVIVKPSVTLVAND